MLLSISKKQIRTFQLLAIFMLTMVSWSCKKETPNLPYNEIESFSIKDASGKTLSASIVEDRIILYWPPLVDQPESITPTVKISDLATLTPASGTPIQLKSDKPIIYTVRAQDGSSKNYTLSFQVNQPLLQVKINFLSPYRLYLPGTNPFVLVGENIIPNEAQTKGYIVDNDGKETLLSFNQPPSTFAVNFTRPDDLKPGTYRLKLVSGRYTVLTDPFDVLLPEFYNLIKLGNYTVKKGENLVMPIANKSIYELFFKADFDHFIAIDNLNNTYKLNNAIFDVAKMTVTIPIPTTIQGNQLTRLKIIDKSDKIMTEYEQSITLN